MQNRAFGGSESIFEGYPSQIYPKTIKARDWVISLQS